MRCCTLASALKKMGHNIFFITKNHSSILIKKIEDQGFTVIIADYNLSLEEDISFTCKIINNYSINAVITDCYRIDYNYQLQLKKTGKLIVVIDDMIYSDRFYCDILINQNLGFSKSDYTEKLVNKPLMLIGPQYALLRDEFKNLKSLKNLEKSTSENIMITMGGSDPDNQTLKALKALNRINNALTINVISGSCCQHVDEIKAFALNSKHIVNVHVDTSEMASLMLKADLSINAGSSTCWELACMGIPGIILVIADNQKRIACALSDYGSHINLGWFENITETDIAQAITFIIKDNNFINMKMQAYKLVDGMGTERVAGIILKYLEETLRTY
jgi:UDP-2,4-diacetamido-2,4,6-trideoxy-beta-L-altropyranose hydrolase